MLFDMKKILLIVLAALSLTGCRYQLDPYESVGNDGARMNINGDKYLMYNDYSVSYSGNMFSLNGTVASALPEKEPYIFTLALEDSEPLTTGKVYPLQQESVKFVFRDTRTVYPTGWIEFTAIGGGISARFEVFEEGFEVRHGFLRVIPRY